MNFDHIKSRFDYVRYVSNLYISFCILFYFVCTVYSHPIVIIGQTISNKVQAFFKQVSIFCYLTINCGVYFLVLIEKRYK